MFDVCCPRYLPCSTNRAAGLPPPCASPEIYIALVVAALIYWFRRNLRHRPTLEQPWLPERVPDQIPAIPEDLDAPTVCSSTAPPQAESEGAGSSRHGDAEDVGDEAGRAQLPLAIYIALVVAALLALYHRPPLEQLPDGVPDQIPAIAEDLDAPTVCSSIAPPQAEAAYPSPSDGTGPSRAGDEAGRAGPTTAFINATVDRSCDVAGILDKMSHAFRGIFLDVHSSDESTIHPANGVLMEFLCGNTDAALSIFGTADSTIENCSAMSDCWLSKLEEEGERIFQGEKGRMHIFLLNNAYDVLQMMRCRGASFSKIISAIERYKKGYFDECWVPLINPCRLDKFTSVFDTIHKRQMTWKVTAELRYTLRQEIVDLILPPYELSLLALKANQSPLSKILYSLKQLMAGKKKQKRLTVEALQNVMKNLFEG